MPPKRRKQKQETKTKAKSKAKAKVQNLPCLPEPIVVRILSKLPIKSLLRFKCVSKSWLSIISDSKFSLTLKREQLMIMVPNSFSRKYNSTYLVDAEKDFVQKIDLPKQLIEGNLKIMGSCNGLVLFSNMDDLFLWNPSTRCCNRVISYPKAYDFNSVNRYDRISSVVSGLCYDSALGIFKAVVASSDFNPPHHHVSVSVGCFKSKIWTEIPFPFSRHKIESGPTVSGRLHWMVTNLVSNYRENFVVCYDPKMNEFVTMSMPQCREIKKEVALVGLGVLDGCLSVALCCGNGSHMPCVFEVLAMKKYDDVTSWTSLFVIPETFWLHGIWLLVPWCHMKKGEVLIQCNNRFLVYNTKTICCREFHMPNGNTDDMSTIVFKESLDCPSSTIRKRSNKFYIQG